ncbi:MAG: hypothetical protein A2W25_04665 [candidate division Zixibacteria bacterium RBG_16_53_22]|nr:MAG: hypothetical protein A2W25_04665 [candidate division Zixibacteria bacterium RBG_16_53_22]
MNLNRAELIGNLAADPVATRLKSGGEIVSFTVVTSRTVQTGSGEKRKDVQFHDVSAFGQLGRVVVKYLKKGDRVYVDGHLVNDHWYGNDGTKHTRAGIVAQNLIMLGGGKREKTNDEVIVEEIDPANV